MTSLRQLNNAADPPGVGHFTQSTAHDHDAWSRLVQFVADQPRAFTRDPHIGGHVTASAFILSKDATSVLLTHHRKLGIWVQLGGHCDGIADAEFVALKEAYEESGLSRIVKVTDDVFDVDIHTIPARKSDPEHLHYDVRFLCREEAGEIAISDESLDLRWVPLADLQDITQEPSMLRMRDRALSCSQANGLRRRRLQAARFRPDLWV